MPRPRRGLLIRHKLHLLVVVPLVGLLLATAPLIADRVNRASQASDLAGLMKAADLIGALVQDVQQERLLSISYLASPDAAPNSLVVQEALVSGTAADLRRSLGSQLTPALAAALDGVDGADGIGALRGQVLQHAITPNRLNSAYDTVVGALIDAIGLIHPRDATVAGSADQDALDALFRADQYRGTAGAALLASVAAPAGAAGSLGAAGRAEQQEAVEVDRFKELATTDQAQLFRLAEFGTASALVNDLQGQIETAHGVPSGSGDQPTAQTAQPAQTLQSAQTTQSTQTGYSSTPADTQSAADRRALVDRLADAVTAQYGLRVLVEEKIAHDIASEAGHAAHTERVAAAGFGVAVEALLIVVIWLSVSIRRSISEPLRGLTEAATEVADLADSELRRVADVDDSGPRSPMPRLAAVRITSRDEVGTLAEAFNRVQATSARLLERQILSRRNVAVMYGSIGRRTLNLVRRQLALIDDLEAKEIDADRLDRLFRLDHAASRLRRSAHSLIVLSGTPYEDGAPGEPLSLYDAVRAAQSDIDDYRRVDSASAVEDLLRPRTAGDVVLVLAELMANAVAFSPPESRVEVSAYRVADDRCVRIVDHGVGMSADRIERENTRLVSRERLDLAPTDVLGLFVVGRLARRHGLSVRLCETPGGGVTAVVVIPDRLFVAAGSGQKAADGTGGTEREADRIRREVAEAIQRAMTAWSGEGVGRRAHHQDTDSPVVETNGVPPAWQPSRDPGTVPFPLARRVPGAHLTPRTGGTPHVPPPTPDPDAVRAEIEAFQAGAARADGMGTSVENR
ncbi:histidine kinase [Catenulispora acidiphila DSM 44928]|uniref:histidine kinase n=1 Tax=Catenulispora acidiphila (strain DSM 44928 / JCM 14897 / NBRC 102108 / NRRL B-24433 / ID139908) TaxID=479433 RepID=C7Q8W7_CATAD|nr:ATP-binding protein [Catenulispora acidiphila]ACU72287.1 histidine kinase [Catenulispora acidiphila DSM 44928]